MKKLVSNIGYSWLSLINTIIYFLITITSHLDNPTLNWIFLVLILLISFVEILSCFKKNTKKAHGGLIIILSLNIYYIIYVLFHG